MRLSLAVADLVPGMLVVELDIPWLDSPFLSNSRRIKGSKDIEALLKAGVKYVVIDTEKGVAPVASHAISPAILGPTLSLEVPLETVPLETKRTLDQELVVATGLRHKIKKAVDNLQLSLERNIPLNIEELTPLVEQTLNSLGRNNQALLSLVHISRKAQKLADHTFSTFCLCLNLALQLDVDADDREAFGLAALLHEAGWVQMPLQLMGKRTAYTALEKKLITNHVEVGLALLQHSSLPTLTQRLIREHHELCDGSGYPYGLKGEQLHPLSRLLSAADNYDERVHQLTDRPGMLPTNALRTLYMEAEKGVFDTAAVAGLISLLGIYPATSAVKLNTGERAVVLEVGEDALNPIIKIVYDSNKKLLATPLIVDMRLQDANGQKRQIESVLDPGNLQDDPFRRLLVED